MQASISMPGAYCSPSYFFFMFDSQGKDDVLKLSNVMKMSKSSKDDEEEVSGKLCYLIALNC